MATQAELNNLESSLKALASHAKTCEGVAIALIEVGGAERLSGLLLSTDYDRARAAMITRAGNTIRDIVALRRTTLSPHLIRAQHQLMQMRKRCRRCRDCNLARLGNSKIFQCLLNAPSDQQDSPFHFELNEKGEIIERS